jgi:hypothetical protein
MRVWQLEAKQEDHAKERAPGCMIVSFSIVSYGRLGVEADKVLKDLAGEAARGLGEGVFLHWIRKAMSLSLMMVSAKVLKKFVGCLMRAPGEWGRTSSTVTTC